MLPPSTVRLKSVIDALFLKTAPAFEKSSASTFGLIRIWSTMLTPAGRAFFSTFVSTAFAESSGKSPVRVTSLPLRAIESGAKDNGGLPGLLEEPVAGGTPAGPTPDRSRSNAPWPIAAISNGTTTKPISHGRPSERRREIGARHGSAVAVARPKRARKPKTAPSSMHLPGRLRPAGDMQPTDSALRNRLRRAH